MAVASGRVVIVAVLVMLGAPAFARSGSEQPLQTAHERRVVARSATPHSLLVAERANVTIISLAGNRLPVPARVRKYPLGLSPDARLVAGVGADAVLIGRVHGGPMTIVLRGRCSSPPCPYGTDPSFAWSPDSQRLAAAANTRHGPTLLKLSNRSGQVIRSFALPRANPHGQGRAHHNLISWSPDGSRLLLMRSSDYGPTAVVALNIKTGKLQDLARLDGRRSARGAWSPDGRLVALTSDAHGGEYFFEIINATNARPITQFCPRANDCNGGTVWARDSRSVFGAVTPTRIDRIYRTGRRTNVIRSSAGWLTPHIALPAGLIYHHSPPTGTSNLLYLHHFATGQRQLLLSSQSGIEAVLPLRRLP